MNITPWGGPTARRDNPDRPPRHPLLNAVLTVALVLNFPSVGHQKVLLSRHAGNVQAVMGLVFAAGVFTGILSGTRMADAMAASVVDVIPTPMGPYLSVGTGIVSIPFTFFIRPISWSSWSASGSAITSAAPSSGAS